MHRRITGAVAAAGMDRGPKRQASLQWRRLLLRPANRGRAFRSRARSPSKRLLPAASLPSCQAFRQAYGDNGAGVGGVKNFKSAAPQVQQSQANRRRLPKAISRKGRGADAVRGAAADAMAAVTRAAKPERARYATIRTAKRVSGTIKTPSGDVAMASAALAQARGSRSAVKAGIAGGATSRRPSSIT